MTNTNTQSSEKEWPDRTGGYALIQYLHTLVNNRNSIGKFNFVYVKYLLENGVNVNKCDDVGQSPFHIVAKHWNIDVARFLLDHGEYKL